MSSLARRSGVLSWCLYDFANSAFTTLVVTFIYPTYFLKAIAENEIAGTAYWSRAIVVCSLVVAFLSPIVGTMADRAGNRKRLLFFSTILCILFTAALYAVQPGQVFLALLCFAMANIAFEIGIVFYNAFLPDIAPPHKIGRVSGYGWALGYAGGLICMILAMVGLVDAEVPWFGFSRDGEGHIRATNLLVAVWFAFFSIPIFLFVEEKKSYCGSYRRSLIRESLGQLAATFRELRKYRQIMRFLLARLFYNDGLIAIFSFGAIYAAGTFGFTMEENVKFGIALNVAAGVGALLMGLVDDRIGGQRTILLSLCGLTLGTAVALTGQSKSLFWAAALCIGFFAGPSQSGSRALLGRLVPKDMKGEFYGFFAFSGKATAFLSPLLLGILTEVFQSQRAGFSVVLLFFMAGGVILMGVKEKDSRIKD